ncbi:NAD(+) diphosphatase [Acaricomes phytoseiuli]|uniref:NAD(+) diphosphatase n=1 Tax=Acaricomes phytoseiuli TaxID=291968 RepID=UPI00037C7CD1|nr:NAD(+) diphosphatase [Acaricomes phytoseiuli]MCW1249003.1 NAD(+) diphosphatase [Acaricomes phytoseiuli]
MIHSAALPWQRALTDRGSERRSAPEFLGQLAGHPQLLFLPLWKGQAWFADGALRYIRADALSAAGIDAQALLEAVEPGQPAPAVYLGHQLPVAAHSAGVIPAESEVVAVSLCETQAAALGAVLVSEHPSETVSADSTSYAPAGWQTFRQLAGQLNATDTQLMIEALGILNWHSVYTHCPRCGAATIPESAGWTRRCPQDGTEHFPRMDPAIIVTVTGADGRLLLGNGASWEPHRFSTLAGFVEPGESLEQAVAREVFEEVGVRIEEVQYLGSQPWPFPASLMLGFTATTKDTELRPDGAEMAAARWFSREELQDTVRSGDVAISHRMSIARALIERWYGGIIEEPERD